MIVQNLSLVTQLDGIDADDLTVVYCSDYTTSNDNDGGTFIYYLDDTTTGDTINTRTAPNGRWKRKDPRTKYVTITPSTSNGYNYDISSFGFMNTPAFIPISIKNASSANTVPHVSIKSKSNTNIVLNITEGSGATLILLGITLLSGSPIVFADVTGLTISAQITGF